MGHDPHTTYWLFSSRYQAALAQHLAEVRLEKGKNLTSHDVGQALVTFNAAQSARQVRPDIEP